MKKKGEMTTQQIVTMIILIASFAVIIFFIGKLALGEETDKEICRNSIVTRASVPDLTKGGVPIDCKRSYVCVTEDGSCDKMSDNPIIKKAETNEEVYEILATELADCWWMFGEGEIDYIEKEVLQKLHCAICSQIAFDSSVKEIDGFESGKFNKSDLYNFMKFENISEDETYLRYLDQEYLFESDESINFGEIDLDKHYYSLTGMVPEISKFKAGLALTVGLVLVPVIAGAGFITIIATGAAGAAGSHFLLAPSLESASFLPEKRFYPPGLISATDEEYKQLNCKDIITSS